MNNDSVRVRFAPSPTGFMHLGNVRAALMNYMLAQQKGGTFVLRLEDTDPQRNVDLDGKQIMADLSWLNLTYNEGPVIGGPYAPYVQSQRNDLYESHLQQLKEMGRVYRCFCTTEELDKKRQRQQALKMPPRYDRLCLKMSREQQEEKALTTPSIWRFRLDDTIVVIHDMARGTVTYDLKNFSDFALTRQDGSFTFMFANFVDDLLMKITHVIRGEDHLTNTALQADLYRVFKTPQPLFWHLPIICNSEGKKLSKRDFGFSLNDLRATGYLPEAIDNYLAIIGTSVTEEIMSLEDLCAKTDFDTMHAAGQIRYDLDKLRWINHKWIARLTLDELIERCRPFLESTYPHLNEVPSETLKTLTQKTRTDFITLADSSTVLRFYFEKPVLDDKLLEFSAASKDIVKSALVDNEEIFDAKAFLTNVRSESKKNNVPFKELFTLLRVLLTGEHEGLGIQELLDMLPTKEAYTRLNAVSR